MISSRVILFCVLAGCTTVNSAKFPASWKKCPKTDNDECLKQAIQDAIIDLKDGNKGLSVLPLDPLHFQRMEIFQGGSSPVSINLTFYEVDLIGHKHLHVHTVKADWGNNKIDFKFNLSENAIVLGDYSVDGKILVLPISGNGKANISMGGLNCEVTIKGSELVKGNKKYFNVEDVSYKIFPQSLYVKFDNLFNGVQSLGDNMNKFLNENWKVILDELRDTISQAMGQAVKQIASAFFLNIPVDQLYES